MLKPEVFLRKELRVFGVLLPATLLSACNTLQPVQPAAEPPQEVSRITDCNGVPGTECAWLEQETQAVLNARPSSATAAGDSSKGILQLSQDGQHQAALTAVEQRLQTQPDDYPSLFLKAVVLQNMGATAEAKPLLEGMLQQFPNQPEPYNNLALIYAEEGDLARAISTLQQAFMTHPSYARVQQNLKEIYATMASQAYSKALDLQQASAAGPHLAMITEVEATAQPAQAHTPQAVAAQTAPAEPTKVTSATTAETLADSATEATQTPEQVEVVEVAPATVVSTVTQESEPEKPSATAQAQAPVAADNTKTAQAAITDHLRNWASAWRNQNHQNYVRAYTDEYRPSPSLTHDQWVAQRALRLSKPQYIKIELGEIQVNMLSEHLAEANFDQLYESDTYKDRVRKRIVLVKTRGEWKISLEQSQQIIN
ncbi:tetratricopeptide repeat protein [Neptuniibacter halophilus]|uniref:tetratricopeptide repeat protein n=1 Tax=Neptuniibacter halophilus TaxID=651666 RepID=UPI002573F6E2|nr:tetratricopeptide repeat protein [Neptuniibacter halophilus]